MKKSAFTLAEILVTLVIIGVISSLTIPNLNQDAKKQEYAAGCLKAYSVLNQIMDKIQTEYGPIGFGYIYLEENEEDLVKAMIKNANVLEYTLNKEEGLGKAGYKYLDNRSDGYIKGYNFTTADGMIILYGNKSSCNTTKGYNTEHVDNCLGRFLVDVNGKKGPNVYGKDVYFFGLIKGAGVLPAGADIGADGGNVEDNCVRGYKGNNAGLTCAAKVIQEKKITYY